LASASEKNCRWRSGASTHISTSLTACDAGTYHILPDKPVSIDVRFASRRLIGRAEWSRPEGDAVRAAI
jgi:hypothetical protein